jgi:ribonuclease BN (tRNA processing enzyme)
VVETLLEVDDLTERAKESVTELDPDAGSFDLGPHRIEYTETTHSAPCFAYCIDDRLAISGDTAPDDSVFELADGSDVLIHECSFPDGVDSAGHTTPTELGDRLGGLSVGAVYLTHLFPETEPHADEIEATVAAETNATVTVPDELDSVDID